MRWRELLPELLADGSLRTQEDLVQALADRGQTVNQATVSRELKRMGVTKVDGAYRLPPRPEVGAPIHSFTATAEDCFVVIKTDPAFATVVAHAIDAAELEGVLGTVAGDDTVFAATSGKGATRRLRTFLGLSRPVRSSR
jgi:transcriptional regulator of arginine metabolism